MPVEMPPVNISVSLSANTLSLGEPIVLRYTFVGTEAESVGFYMGRHKQHWLTLDLVDAQGNHALPSADPRMRQGGIRTDTIGASATSHAVEYVVVTRTVRPTHPGQYRLTASARMPYATNSQRSSVPSSNLWEQTFGTVLTREDTFELTVTEAEPARLLSVAEQLVAQVVRDHDFAGNKIAFQALFSMPEEYVLPVWRAVTTSENMRLVDQWSEISDELARLQTIQSANLLAEMVWNPPAPVREYLDAQVPPVLGTYDPDEPFVFSPIGASNVWLKFNNMYFTADPVLKEHLVNLYKSYGRDVPRQPTLIID